MLNDHGLPNQTIVWTLSMEHEAWSMEYMEKGARSMEHGATNADSPRSALLLAVDRKTTVGAITAVCTIFVHCEIKR